MRSASGDQPDAGLCCRPCARLIRSSTTSRPCSRSAAVSGVRSGGARPGHHQGIAQRVPADEGNALRATVTDIDVRQIRRKPVLGGLINEYTYAA